MIPLAEELKSRFTYDELALAVWFLNFSHYLPTEPFRVQFQEIYDKFKDKLTAEKRKGEWNWE